MTMEEIANKFGITRERVRQIKEESINLDWILLIIIEVTCILTQHRLIKVNNFISYIMKQLILKTLQI